MSQQTKFVLDYSKSALGQNLAQFSNKIGAAMLMYATTKSTECEAYMKLHRPWTDRTNQAKTTLNSKVSQPNDHTIRITLAHGVDYGIWLELAHEKRYAIIGPTVTIKSVEIMQDMKNLMSKIRF